MEREHRERDFQIQSEASSVLGTSTEKREFAFKEIEELREPLQEVLGKIREKIDGHQYDLIIGEETSGRIPTLVVTRLMKRLYGETEKLQALFFAGGRSVHNAAAMEKKYEGIQQSLKKVLDSQNAKEALVVTDTILSGGSVQPITDSLKQLGKRFDLLALGHESGLTVKFSDEDIRSRLGVEPIYGMKGTPTIVKHPDKHRLSGVTKHWSDTHAKARQSDASGLDPQEDRLPLNDARADVQQLSDELYEWYQATRQGPGKEGLTEGSKDTLSEEVKK